MTFWALMGEVVLLGLAAAITPGLFAMQVLQTWIQMLFEVICLFWASAMVLNF